MTWYLIWGLKKLGLATKVKLPTQKQLDRMRSSHPPLKSERRNQYTHTHTHTHTTHKHTITNGESRRKKEREREIARAPIKRYVVVKTNIKRQRHSIRLPRIIYILGAFFSRRNRFLFFLHFFHHVCERREAPPMTRETRDESSLPPSASSSSSSLPFALARFPGAKNRGLKSASSLREGSIVFQSVPYSAVLRDAGLHERDHFTFELPTTKSTTSSVSQLQRCSATKFARYFLERIS